MTTILLLSWVVLLAGSYCGALAALRKTNLL